MSDLPPETLTVLSALLAAGEEQQAQLLLNNALPAQYAEAAALALAAGRPRLAAHWAVGHVPLLHAAALLRLGASEQALALLESVPASARVQVLWARALATLTAAESARSLARREADGPAIIAAVTLMGERLLPTDPRAALLALAEGLKVAEQLNREADAHLLAVLAHVQARLGGAGKAHKTAQKALDRSLPRSPARIVALLALGRPEDAEAERLAGELSADWVRAFLLH
ncbi:hypothetical protein MF271_15805 [Deinococcus sp. KNUC1210]|uniref:hypothetical protein n=1 Tax=Deinococcus sp. KNUC1210 TaxID=2917691 RepID=UPI001EF0EEBB|nr:hypothetical protein [Deinococcus sp. KNUC1210]ULH15376.1 hypothetical protein MF271_15805 [Deinococcus sp. KNUC1210]